MQQIIQPFNINNLSQIVEFVKPMWTFSGWEDSFRNFYAETILRNNYFMSYNIISIVSHFTAFCCKDKLKYGACGKMIMCIIVSGYKSAVSQIFWREILSL